MIWHRGQIIADDALRISVLDRAFEHGLGLFETFRTWNGRPTLLGRHLERMTRSAGELLLPLDTSQLPDAEAIHQLIQANSDSLPPGEDVRLRLTLSGGLPTITEAASTVWLAVGPMPPTIGASGAVISRMTEVSEDDLLARHKTLNYWHKRIAHAQAVAQGSDDVLYVTAAGMICETSRANIFLVEGRHLLTPSLTGPLLPGVMRGVVLEHAERMGLDILDDPLPRERLTTADEAFLTSSLRGMLPIVQLFNRTLPSPGPVTRQLWNEIRIFLETEGRSR